MFQDIRQPRRSLKEILPRKPEPAPLTISRTAEAIRPSPQLGPREPAKRSSSFIFLILGLVAIMTVILVVVTAVMASAHVTVTPKTIALNFESTAVIYGPVEVMSLQTKPESTTLKATGSQHLLTKATGKVILYNNFSSSAQKLVKNTRLQTKTGKIYRLAETVSIPGYKKVGDKITPGQIETSVVADQPGESYNSDATDFSLPAYASDSRATKIFGRSSGALAGGSDVEQPVVSDSDKQAATDVVNKQLKQRIFEQARFQIPKNFVLFDDGVFITYTQKIEPVASSSNEARLTTTATVKALLFEENKLTQLLLQATGATTSGATFSIPDLKSLNLTIANKTAVNPGADKTVTLIINGKTTAVASVDTAKLSAALAGQSKDQATATFNNFASIASAEVSFQPPWLRHFPKNPATNQIELKNPPSSSLTP